MGRRGIRPQNKRIKHPTLDNVVGCTVCILPHLQNRPQLRRQVALAQRPLVISLLLAETRFRKPEGQLLHIIALWVDATAIFGMHTQRQQRQPTLDLSRVSVSAILYTQGHGLTHPWSKTATAVCFTSPAIAKLEHAMATRTPSSLGPRLRLVFTYI